MTIIIPKPFGPNYPVELGATVVKFRRIRNPTYAQRQAHGEAVLDAIRKKQRPRQREVSFTPHCASGTWHTDGDEIIKAVRQQQRAALLAAGERDRNARTPKQWRDDYEAAMKEKNAAALQAGPPELPRRRVQSRADQLRRSKQPSFA